MSLNGCAMLKLMFYSSLKCPWRNWSYISAVISTKRKTVTKQKKGGRCSEVPVLCGMWSLSIALGSYFATRVCCALKFKRRLRVAYPSSLMPAQSRTAAPRWLISAGGLELFSSLSPPLLLSSLLHIPCGGQALKWNRAKREIWGSVLLFGQFSMPQ